MQVTSWVLVISAQPLCTWDLLRVGVAMKLRHSELACHQKGLMQQLRDFWKEGHLCDVVLKSIDGTQHPVHRNVLSAASAALKALLCAPFREAEQIRQGKPIEMAASGGVVGALVDYIYGGEPDVATVDAVELLRLAGAYGLPCLAQAVEADLKASLDSQLALQLLQETVIWGMPDLRSACEEQVAKDFQQCTLTDKFLKLTGRQLQRILHREDLNVSREEIVVEVLLKWAKYSKDRQKEMTYMLPNIDFPSLSSSNLHVLCHAAESWGPNGADWECEVKQALSLHRKRPSSEVSRAHRPKRRCLSHWIGQQVWELPRNVIVLERSWLQPSRTVGLSWLGIKVPSSSVAASHPKFCLANPARRTFGLLLAKVLLSTGSISCNVSGDLPRRPMERWVLGIMTQMRSRNSCASRMVWERSCLTSHSWKMSVLHPMGWFMFWTLVAQGCKGLRVHGWCPLWTAKSFPKSMHLTLITFLYRSRKSFTSVTMRMTASCVLLKEHLCRPLWLILETEMVSTCVGSLWLKMRGSLFATPAMI